MSVLLRRTFYVYERPMLITHWLQMFREQEREREREKQTAIGGDSERPKGEKVFHREVGESESE